MKARIFLGPGFVYILQLPNCSCPCDRIGIPGIAGGLAPVDARQVERKAQGDNNKQRYRCVPFPGAAFQRRQDFRSRREFPFTMRLMPFVFFSAQGILSQY